MGMGLLRVRLQRKDNVQVQKLQRSFLDLEPAKRGENIKPRVERSGTLGICNEIICKPAKRAAADG